MLHTLDADERLIEQGSRLITKYNCIGCHRMGQLPKRWTLEGADEDELLTSLEEFIEEGLDNGLWMAEAFRADGRDIFAAHAWVSDEFYFDQEEEDYDVLEYFEYDSSVESIPDEVYVYGHDEGAMGGYIDEKAMRPPILRGEGAKVHPDWLFEFLLAPYTVRNHVNVRMPSFALTESESLALVRWFAAQADEPWPFEVDGDSVVDDDLMRFGREKFNEYQCNSCHPAGDVMPSNPDPANWGPDLSMAAARLKPGWIHSWIQDPQQDQPGTKMPNFLGEFSDGEYEPYYDDWEEILRGLQHYLRHMNDWDEE